MTLKQAKLLTADDLMEISDQERCELIDGELFHMAPTGAEHGDIALLIGSAIRAFVQANRLGKVYGAETGFLLSHAPDTVRAPDVAFVHTARLPPKGHRGFIEGPPDLAVEVLSPTDRASDVAAKTQRWLNAGTISVWVVDAPNRSITIFRSSGFSHLYGAKSTLDTEPTLPGFSIKIAEVFADQ